MHSIKLSYCSAWVDLAFETQLDSKMSISFHLLGVNDALVSGTGYWLHNIDIHILLVVQH